MNCPIWAKEAVGEPLCCRNIPWRAAGPEVCWLIRVYQIAVAFSKPFTCYKSLGYASVRPRSSQLFEFRCLRIGKVGPGIGKFQGIKKWLGGILEAIEEVEVTFSLELAL
jgi:hypothetical protein